MKNRRDSLAVWAITPNGLALGRTLCQGIPGARLFASENLIPDPNMGQETSHPGATPTWFKGLARELTVQFTRFSAHLFIFSTGIAVRMIAPLINSKLHDPAVVVVDEKGIHAISLLSGHLGGANDLAREVADLIHARPVITTATDINQLPSIDLVAQKNRLFIENPWAIKHVNMVFLKEGTLDIYDPLNFLKGDIPDRFVGRDRIPERGTGVACTWKLVKVPRETLVLRPRVLSIGMGCNRNTPMACLHDFLLAIFQREGLSLNAVFTLATTQLKADEPGLIRLAEKLGLPLKFYDNDQLNSVDTIQTPSQMVEKHIGVKSVCEAAAILAASRGKLIVPKQKNKDVTLAVAISE